MLIPHWSKDVHIMTPNRNEEAIVYHELLAETGPKNKKEKKT